MSFTSESNALVETWFGDCACLVNKDYSVTFPSCTSEFLEDRKEVTFSMNLIAKSVNVIAPIKGRVNQPVEKLPCGEFKIDLPIGLLSRMAKNGSAIERSCMYQLSFAETLDGDMVGITIHLT